MEYSRVLEIHIGVNEMDDPGFIDIFNLLVVSYITSHSPEQVWLIQIDNWFDQKWLHFSGNVAVPLGTPLAWVRVLLTTVLLHVDLSTVWRHSGPLCIVVRFL
jgi:hypothetical protein